MSGFWGLVVKPGSKPTPMRATPGEMVMVLKQAALAPNGKLGSETSVLSVSVGPDTNERFVLCHLTPGKCEQWAIDLGFGPDEEVHFHLTGKCPVHLTGFYELDDDDEDEDEDSDEALARYEGEGMYDDEDDEDDSEEDGEEDEADGMDEEIDSDDVEEDDDEDEGDQDGPRIVELDANGQPVEVEDDSEDDEEDEDDDEEDEEDDDEDDDEDEEDDEQEFTAEELKKKRDELFKGLNPSDLASDDDDDLDDEDDEMEGEEDEEDESDDEDDDEGEEDDDEDEDEEGEEDESEEEDLPPPQSKKRSSMASTTAATPSKKMKGTPDAKASAGTPGVGWTAAEEAKLKKAAGATDANTPNRWAKVATAVGGGKSKDACKKHYKELGGK